MKPSASSPPHADGDDPKPKGRAWVPPLIKRAAVPTVEVEGAAHVICFANPAFCRLVGRTPEAVLGKRFSEIVRNGEKCVPLLNRIYATGEGETHVAQDNSAKETAFWLYAMWPALASAAVPERVVIQLTRAANANRNIAAMNEALMVGALRQHELREAAEQSNALLQVEITERKVAGEALVHAIDALKIAQEAAERGSRAKDDFLAALSHELRTPLTPVLLSAAALREDERLPADVRVQLAMMERNIALEARLVDDLLDLTKIAHGKLALRVEPCDAHQLIVLAVDMIRDEAQTKNVAITCDFAARRRGVLADPVRFQQVIWNLLRNAVKFTPSGGRIAVSTGEEPTASGQPGLKIDVADTGIGVAPDQLEHIFLPFDQGSLSGNHRFGGVGLGLAIARAIIDLHGGRLSAHSAGANLGTTLTVLLPRAVEMSVQVPVAAAPAAIAPSPLRLLLVEDHANTRQALQRLLLRDGHSVIAAASVGTALEAAASSMFDLVISDLGLPDGTGLELMAKLRDEYGLTGIALTGYGAGADVEASRRAGFISHLTKPVALADLRHVLASVPRPTPEPTI